MPAGNRHVRGCLQVHQRHHHLHARISQIGFLCARCHWTWGWMWGLWQLPTFQRLASLFGLSVIIQIVAHFYSLFSPSHIPTYLRFLQPSSGWVLCHPVGQVCHPPTRALQHIPGKSNIHHQTVWRVNARMRMDQILSPFPSSRIGSMSNDISHSTPV